MKKNVSIPVFKIDLTNDERVKKIVQDILLVGGIDINDRNYDKNSVYLKIKNLILGFYPNINLSIEDLVERYFVPDEIKEIYDLGCRKIDEDKSKYEFNKLYDYITEYDSTYGVKDLKSYFERNRHGTNPKSKDGLIRRLYNWEVDIDKFDKPSVCKLLRFLFRVEKRNNINLFPMLKKPSLENVDNSRHGVDTINGEIMMQLKSGMAKEIPFEKMYRYNCILINIVRMLEETSEKAYGYILNSSTFNIEKMSQVVDNLPLQELFIEIPPEIPQNSPSLFELMYLKFIQHENLGMESDIHYITRNEFIDEFSLNGLNTQKFDLNEPDELVKTQDVKSMLEDDLKEGKKIVKLVFNKDKITKAENDRYKLAVNYIDNFLDILVRNSVHRKNIVSKNLVVSALQCFLFIDKSKKLQKICYRYEKTDMQSLYREMQRGKNAHEINQMAIFRLIWNNYYRRYEREEVLQLAYKVDNYIDNALERILSGDSIEKMLYTFFNIYFDLEGAISTNEMMQETIKKINAKLNGDYKIKINVKKIIPIIYTSYESNNVIDNCANIINEEVCSNSSEYFEKNLKIPFEGLNRIYINHPEYGKFHINQKYKLALCEYMFKFNIDRVTKEVVIKCVDLVNFTISI